MKSDLRIDSIYPLRRWSRPIYETTPVASILLLAFSAGGWLVDWGVRRRHGGFRI